MSGIQASRFDGTVVEAVPLTLSMERLRNGLLWLTAFAGGFVFVEPSPYEFVSVVTITLFAVTGFSLTAALTPLTLLLIVYVVGLAIGLVRVADQTAPVLWVMVSVYLSATAVFFAAILQTRTQNRLATLLRGYTAAAIVASIVAIAGYFGLFGARSDLFLLYERARGTFNDPNVLGAFLVLPGLLAFQGILLGRLRKVIWSSLILFLILAALFLSFSRGAWGQFSFAALLMMALMFATNPSPARRLRIVFVAMAGLLVLAGFIAALLSIDQVSELFKERASLEQNYDVGHTGRFGRHLLGFLLALDEPFGIGPMQFHKLFFEDPHNAFLNAFMAGGWLSGFSYLTLTLVTIVVGLRLTILPTPWQSTFLAVYAAFAGTVAESVIIDSDHWRHYFLLLGLVWGLVVASRPYLAASRAHQRRRDHGLAGAISGLARARSPA